MATMKVTSQPSPRHFVVAHEIVTIDDRSYADNVVRAILHGEALAFNLHGVARFLLAGRIRERGFKTVLSGDGADEIFAGYRFASRDAGAAVHGSVPRQAKGGPDALLSIRNRLGFVPHWLDRLAVDRSILHLVIGKDMLALGRATNVYQRFLNQFDIEAQLTARESLMQSLYIWSKSTLTNYLLVAERLEMAHTVEVRLPYLDHRLFEKVRAIPQGILSTPGLEKPLLRRIMQPYVTSRVNTNRKQPFTAPPLKQRLSSLNALIRDYVTGSALDESPFFDKASVLALLEAQGQKGGMEFAVDTAVLAILSICVMQKEWAISA